MTMTESEKLPANGTGPNSLQNHRKERDKNTALSTSDSEESIICLCNNLQSLNLQPENENKIIYKYLKYLRIRERNKLVQARNLNETQEKLLRSVAHIVQKFIKKAEEETLNGDVQIISRSPMRTYIHTPLYTEPYPTRHQQEDIFNRNEPKKIEETNVELLEQIRMFANDMKQPENLKDFVLSYLSLSNLPVEKIPYNISGALPPYHPYTDYRQSRHSFSSTSSTTSSPPVSPAASSVGNSSPARVDVAELSLGDSSYIPTTIAEATLTSFADRLLQRLDPEKKLAAWVKVNQLDLDMLGKGDDNDNDTQLMILLTKKPINLEFTYSIVERFLKESPNYLTVRNKQDHDALLMVIMANAEEPLVAGYLAEALIRAHITPDDHPYLKGNSLLHKLALFGDSRVTVLKEMLKLKFPDGRMAFNVNAKNSEGSTPLHLACRVHGEQRKCYQVVNELLAHGADLLQGDYYENDTPLHVLIQKSADEQLVKMLIDHLQSLSLLEKALEMVNRKENTVLHLACARNNLSLEQQKSLVRSLYKFPTQVQFKNISGQVPSFLINPTRKMDIKPILQWKPYGMGHY